MLRFAPRLGTFRLSASVLLSLTLLLCISPVVAARTALREAPVADRNVASASYLLAWRRGAGGLVVGDSLLAGRIRVLRYESATFDAAWRTLEASGVSIVIGTPGQLAEVLPSHVRESSGWAGVTVSWGRDDGALSRSAVVIRSDWLRGLHARIGTPEASYEAALDELLVHEIYGHLVPVVEARSTLVRCPDPGPHERLGDSCVGRREMAIRVERERLPPVSAANW